MNLRSTALRIVIALAVLPVLIMAGCGPDEVPTPEVSPTLVVSPAPVVPTVAVGVTQAALEPEPEGEVAPVLTYDPFATERPLSEVGYVMPPTVQHLTETTASILFQFEAAQPGILFYRLAGNEPGPVQAVALDPSYERHEILLEDLTPGSPYDMVVVAGTGEPETSLDVPFLRGQWGSQSFHTPPYDTPLRFAVIGDSGFGGPVTYSLGQLIADYAPDFVLHVGDLTYTPQDFDDPYQTYQYEVYSPFSPFLRTTPLYPAIGNHDYYEEDIQLFERPFYYWAFPLFEDPAFPPSAFDDARKWYAFEAGGVQFIGLDTQVFFGDSGRQEQLDWLAERLADERFPYSVAFLHVPPYTSGFHRDEMLAVRPLAAMLEAAGVPLAFAGHDHDYEHLIVGSTNYFVTGGGSAVVYGQEERDEYSRIFVTRSHYLEVELTTDEITVRAVAPDGSVFDEVSLPVP